MEALEAACVALHAPPTGPEAERRRTEAEAVLEHFKRSPQALQDAMALLQAPATPAVVQFHCVATLREVTLKRWSALPSTDKARALDFLMQLLYERYASLPHFVSGAALQTVVLLMKRGWLDRTTGERAAILQQMGAMLQPSETPGVVTTRLIAAKWLLAFVTEFSSASRASAMLQPVEFHTKSRRLLEKHGLQEIVQFAIPLLEDSIRSTTSSCGPSGEGSVPKEQLELLEAAFLLCVELLNWNFEDVRTGNLTWSLSVSAEDSGNRPVITPQRSWRPVLVRPELIHSAFNTYAFFRTVTVRNETLLHLSRQFLIQLASLHGPIFQRDEEKLQFMAEIFRGVATVVHNPFLDMLAQNDMAGYELATRELIDCCQLLFRLVNTIGFEDLVATSAAQLFTSFLEELAALSSKLLRSALDRIQRHLRTSPSETIDELWELEGMDILLDAWVALVNHPLLMGLSDAPLSPEVGRAASLLREYSAPVMELYLQVQLELCAVEALADQDEDEDVEDNAASGSREQFELAAALARMNAGSSASLLLSLTQSLLASVQQELGKLQGRDEMTAELSQLFEKLHFVVQFAGLFLADDYASERPSIPQRIQQTLQSVTSAESSPVISLLMLLMSQLLEFESSRLAQNPTSECVSPFVSEEILKTTTRLCATYLSPDVLSGAGEVSPALLQVFGFQNGGRAGDLLSFLVQHTTVYLMHWPTQPVVMENFMEFLLVLANTKAIGCVLGSHMWQSLVQANASAGSFMVATQGESALHCAVARVPSELRGQLTEALCRAGMVSTDEAMRVGHFEAVSAPVQQRLQQLIAMPNFESKETTNDVRVQEELKLLLEMYAGIARSAETNSQKAITAFCLPALPVLVRVFDLFHGNAQVVNLTLRLFCQLVEAQLCYLSPHDALQVYTASDNLIRSYCGHNLGKKSALGDAEEENFSDLLALLTLLSHLVSKDFIDFSEETEGLDADEAARASSVVADVVFSGLRQVVPLMTEPLLAYPSLSKQYFTLVSYMVEVYANKLATLPSDLFQMILHSLLVGIRHVNHDVARYSFQALGELAAYHLKAQQNQESGLQRHVQENPELFMAFLRVIFRMALFEDFNPVILDAAASTLYPLVLIEHARYSALADEISREQAAGTDTATQQRLAAAFAELTQFLTPADVASDSVAISRKLRMQFKSNLYAFVAEVRGFLQVK